MTIARKTTQAKAAKAFAAGQTVVISTPAWRREYEIGPRSVTHNITGSVSFAELVEQADVFSAAFYVVPVGA